MISPAVHVKVSNKGNKALDDAVELLLGLRVLVGVPEENDEREEGIGNAALAMIHDKGSPLNGIPARPFMGPGIAKARRSIERELKTAATSIFAGATTEAVQALHRAGMRAAMSVKNVINTGEGFEPLKRGTLLGRMRRRKYLNKKLSRAEKEEYMASFHPLVDTGMLRDSITYVVDDDGSKT